MAWRFHNRMDAVAIGLLSVLLAAGWRILHLRFHKGNVGSHFRPRKHGAPHKIRTCDLRLRRPLLYPAELMEHTKPVNLCNLMSTGLLVEVTGFEPAAPCSQSTCATNCATPRNHPPVRIVNRLSDLP